MEEWFVAKTAKKKLDDRPVKFSAGCGVLTVKDAHHRLHPVSGLAELDPGLRVLFTPSGQAHDEPIGGYSREFYPTEDNHRADSELCDCMHCLQAVRDFIADRRNAEAIARHHIVEVDPDANVKLPFPKWNSDDLNAKGLEAVYETVGFDLHGALRYEAKNLNRKPVIAAIEALLEKEAAGEVADGDVTSVEVDLD